jgi:hypothetical protein
MSMALLLVYGAATVVMAATTVTMPEHRPLAPAMFMLGLVATWRQFVRWRGTGGSI